jgi:hypothetical protein
MAGYFFAVFQVGDSATINPFVVESEIFKIAQLVHTPLALLEKTRKDGQETCYHSWRI